MPKKTGFAIIELVIIVTILAGIAATTKLAGEVQVLRSNAAIFNHCSNCNVNSTCEQTGPGKYECVPKNPIVPPPDKPPKDPSNPDLTKTCAVKKPTANGCSITFEHVASEQPCPPDECTAPPATPVVGRFCGYCSKTTCIQCRVGFGDKDQGECKNDVDCATVPPQPAPILNLCEKNSLYCAEDCKYGAYPGLNYNNSCQERNPKTHCCRTTPVSCANNTGYCLREKYNQNTGNYETDCKSYEIQSESERCQLNTGSSLSICCSKVTVSNSTAPSPDCKDFASPESCNVGCPIEHSGWACYQNSKWCCSTGERGYSPPSTDSQVSYPLKTNIANVPEWYIQQTGSGQVGQELLNAYLSDSPKPVQSTNQPAIITLSWKDRIANFFKSFKSLF